MRRPSRGLLKSRCEIRRQNYRPNLRRRATEGIKGKQKNRLQRQSNWVRLVGLSLTKGLYLVVVFPETAVFSITFLKADLTLFLAFGFLLFEIGGIKSSSMVVSREIKIESIFYTCLIKQFLAFLQLTAYNSFLTTHSPQHILPTVTAQPNTPFT